MVVGFACFVDKVEFVVDAVDAVVEEAVVVLDDLAWCFLWWDFAADFVSVSDFGALVTVVEVSPTCDPTADPLDDATDEVAGASSATTIAPVPIAAPTPVTAVTRRTRRRTWSRFAAAAAFPRASMSLPSPPSLSRV